MYAKNFVLLAAASLIADAVAVNVHRHAHGQVHQNQKKDLKIETEFATVTEWVTVTYDPNAPTTTADVKYVAASHSKNFSRTRKFSKVSSSSSVPTVAAPETSSVSSSSVAEPTPSSSSLVVIPTTLVPIVKPTEAEKAPTSIDIPVAAPATTAAPAPPAPTTAEAPKPAPTTASASAPAAAPASSGGKKGRGLAYNDPSLLSGFVGDNSKVTWCYNWGQTNDQKQPIEFIPMLWGPGDNHVNTWQANANKAIASGSSALLSFNEPDNAGQANIDPATAAAAHIQHMNPFAGQARISTPAITNSGAEGQGISWLTQWVSACGGQCHFDFAAVHWYSDNTDDFLKHLKDVHAAVGVPVWVTEFAPVGNNVNYNDFLATVVHQLDTNPDYAFVERYSFFMVSEGENRLVSGGQPNQLGNTFAYAS